MSNRGMPDLWDFFHNEGTIMVRGPAGSAVGALKITEVMAAKDATLGARSKYCQWIEVYNRTGADIDFRDAGWMFDFRQGGVFPLPAVATATDAGRVDLVSNMGNPGYWDIKSTGRAHRSCVYSGCGAACVYVSEAASSSMKITPGTLNMRRMMGIRSVRARG